MPFTLLHTADLHLGKSFCTLPPERAGQRRADLLATLARLCRTARERRVDLLVVAGDLFDRPQPAQALVAAARRALADAGVPVLLVPGNHDPLDAGSPYLDDAWPGNVRVARDPGWQRVPIDGPETWAFGYARGSAHQSPWRDFPGAALDALLVLHAACGTADGSYYPFTPAEIPPCGYLALGHAHRQTRVAPAAWYAGTPEPLEAELTPAAALLVTDGVAEPLTVATRRHRAVTLDATGCSADELWARALAAPAADDLLTLTLTGLLEADLDLIALQRELAPRCFALELRTDDLHHPLPADAEGVLGALVRLAAAREDALPPGDAGRARLARAARLAALALEGKL
jgi:3',5'-cyclic AMP phosphodiesterase CpdA